MEQPDEFFHALQALDKNVSRETFDRLRSFEARFRQWNGRINLVSDKTLDDFWTRHVVDSAQLISLSGRAKQWLDLGSGGGFPGLIIAFLLPADGHISLVDSNRKKAAFLQSIVGEFGLPATVHASRIEDVGAGSGGIVEIVTARALAELPLLLDLASPWLLQGSRGLFHKGRDYRAEVAKGRRFWQFDLVEHVSKTDQASVILEVSNLRQGSSES